MGKKKKKKKKRGANHTIKLSFDKSSAFEALHVVDHTRCLRGLINTLHDWIALQFSLMDISPKK